MAAKNVVGEPVQSGDVTIIPLVSYGFGFGAGTGVPGTGNCAASSLSALEGVSLPFALAATALETATASLRFAIVDIGIPPRNRFCRAQTPIVQAGRKRFTILKNNRESQSGGCA